MPRISSLKSITDAKKSLQKFIRDVQIVTAQELETFRVNVETEAKAQVPIGETGRLQDSIKVRVSRSKTKPGVNITALARSPESGYNYAPIQHEREDFEHTRGKWHYLSDPFNQELKKFKARIRRRLKANG